MTGARDRLREQVLVLRCQAGDAAALAALVERHDRRLRHYVRHMLSNTGAAADVVQDVWCGVFRTLPRLRDPHAFVPWLYRVARNRVQLERRRRRLPVVGGAVESLPAPGDRARSSAVDTAAVRGALDRLCSDHREVLVLRFLHEMSYQQIAAVIGRPIGTVRSRLHHAKTSLRQTMSPGESELET
ncbi:MAG: sigma-70 family RNA polymerase sigma factor [Planctomycetota bacterium]